MIGSEQLEVFLDRLASSDPTPGGGAVAAVSGATGAALIEMVARLTIGKEEFASAEKWMLETLATASAARADMLALADTDAEAFDGVMASFKLPKTTDTERTVRTHAIQTALAGAAAVPLEVARRSVALLELVPEAIALGNPNAASDGGSAAQTLAAATRCALYNVAINAGSLRDGEQSNAMAAESAALRARAIELVADCDAAFRARIS